jgi:hypothetical protein
MPARASRQRLGDADLLLGVQGLAADLYGPAALAVAFLAALLAFGLVELPRAFVADAFLGQGLLEALQGTLYVLILSRRNLHTHAASLLTGKSVIIPIFGRHFQKSQAISTFFRAAASVRRP